MYKIIRTILMLMAFVVWVTPNAAYAYIGPGAGISAIGSLLALLAAVLLAIVGFVWYPIKRLMKNRRKLRTKTPDKNKDKGASL